MQAEHAALDGNAIAGLLFEVFGAELTAATGLSGYYCAQIRQGRRIPTHVTGTASET